MKDSRENLNGYSMRWTVVVWATEVLPCQYGVRPGAGPARLQRGDPGPGRRPAG
jgi:hypothetical protein